MTLGPGVKAKASSVTIHKKFAFSMELEKRYVIVCLSSIYSMIPHSCASVSSRNWALSYSVASYKFMLIILYAFITLSVL